MQRADLLSIHSRVEQATTDLVRACQTGLPASERVHELLEQGAMTDRLPMFAWREAVQEDNLPVLSALIDGSERMAQEDRFERLRLAASYGSEAAMRLFLDRDFCPHFPAYLGRLLTAAVQADRVGAARALLSVGSDARQCTDNRNRKTLVSAVSSVEMLDLLVEHGATPTKADLLDAALLAKPPRPDLLRRFLELGASLTDTSTIGMPWLVLLRDATRVHEFPAQMLECAQLLLQAGAERNPDCVYPLPVLLLALDAGMPIAEATPTVEKMWDARVLAMQDFFPASAPQAKGPKDDFLRLVAGMLIQLEGHGVPLDRLSEGPMPAGDWARAFLFAGIDPGVSFDFTPEVQSEIDAARLRRAAHPRPPRPVSSRRL